MITLSSAVDLKLKQTNLNNKLLLLGEKPFKCDACSKTFARRDSLQAHVRTHTKPFTCGKCGRSFARPDSLVAHARNHAGHSDRPFKCVECGKGFGVAQALQTHMRIHTGERMCLWFRWRLPTHRQTNSPNVNIDMWLYKSSSCLTVWLFVLLSRKYCKVSVWSVCHENRQFISCLIHE